MVWLVFSYHFLHFLTLFDGFLAQLWIFDSKPGLILSLPVLSIIEVSKGFQSNAQVLSSKN